MVKAERVETAPGLRQAGLRLLLGLGIAILATLLALLLVALAVFYYDVNLQWAAPIVTTLSMVFLFVGAQIASKKIFGFWFGALCGALFYLIVYMCALAMFADFSFSLRTAVFILIGGVVGGLGSLMGKNATPKKTKRKKR